VLRHVEIFVRDLERSAAFWAPFMSLLGDQDERWSGGMDDVQEAQAYLCFLPALRERLTAGYHQKRVGLNHLAFTGASRASSIRRTHHTPSRQPGSPRGVGGGRSRAGTSERATPSGRHAKA